MSRGGGCFVILVCVYFYFGLASTGMHGLSRASGLFRGVWHFCRVWWYVRDVLDCGGLRGGRGHLRVTAFLGFSLTIYCGFDAFTRGFYFNPNHFKKDVAVPARGSVACRDVGVQQGVD